MSEQGIKLAAEAFQHLQRLGHELLKMGASAATTPSGRQDIRLAKMLDVGKDAMKDTFIKIISEPKP